MNFSKRKSGFTLIELVVVMTVLMTVLAITVPKLSRFFTGRTLDEEAKRFLALIRYARSEAISRSAPMELWVDPVIGHYGLSPSVGYSFADNKKPIEFVLDDTLRFDLGNVPLKQNDQTIIRCLPDGLIDDQSIERLSLRNKRNEEIWIVRTTTGQEYRIQKDEWTRDDFDGETAYGTNSNVRGSKNRP